MSKLNQHFLRLSLTTQLKTGAKLISTAPITGESSLSEFGAAHNLNLAALDHPIHDVAREMGLPLYVSLDETHVHKVGIAETQYSMTGRIHITVDKRVFHTMLTHSDHNFEEE